MSDTDAEKPRSPAPGTLLSGDVLRREIVEYGHVFVPGTWEGASIRTSGYDLRLARYPLVRPKTPGSSEYITHDAANPSSEFILAPGDSALVSTAEAFALDFQITSLIGPKFKWSARGIIMLQGAVAHPGYGLIKQPDGSWDATDDVRLYFVIANIGPEAIALRPGDQIAYLQFFSVTPELSPSEVPSDGYEYLRSKLFSGNAPDDATGLYYFRSLHKLETRMHDLDAKVLDAQTAVDRANNASDMVVVFGVFLVTATLLGLVLTNLIGAIETTQKLSFWRAVSVVGLELLFAGGVLYGVFLVTKATRNVLSRHGNNLE